MMKEKKIPVRSFAIVTQRKALFYVTVNMIKIHEFLINENHMTAKI